MPEIAFRRSADRSATPPLTRSTPSPCVRTRTFAPAPASRVKFSEILVAEIAEVLSCEKAFGNRVASDKPAAPPASARQKSRRFACIIPDAPLTQNDWRHYPFRAPTPSTSQRRIYVATITKPQRHKGVVYTRAKCPG